jgi:hypothetical protein
MSVSPEFINAWRSWQHATSPYAQHSSQEIEYDLSHMESYLQGIGVDAIAGKPLPYSEIAQRELSDLDALTLRLEDSERSPNDKRALSEHIAIIRAVWSAMKNLDG